MTRLSSPGRQPPRTSPERPNLCRILVGERYNTRGRVPASSWETLLMRPAETYVRVQTQMRAFSESQLRLLRDRMGLEWEYAMNLLSPSIVPGEWDVHEAEHAASLAIAGTDYMWSAHGVRRLFVACGRRVARAFYSRAREMDVGEIADLDGCYMAYVPHPSGMNRQWNEHDVIEYAARELRRSMEMLR